MDKHNTFNEQVYKIRPIFKKKFNLISNIHEIEVCLEQSNDFNKFSYIRG